MGKWPTGPVYWSCSGNFCGEMERPGKPLQVAQKQHILANRKAFSSVLWSHIEVIQDPNKASLVFNYICLH